MTPLGPARPEIELMLACARARLDDERAARVRTLAEGPLDWKLLLEVAPRHGLVPLLYTHLAAAARDAVPTDVMQALRERVRANAGRAMLTVGTLHRLIDILDAAGIAAMPYKGPALAMQAYGSVTLRQAGDLDILVRRGDAIRAGEVLAADGWTAQYALSPARQRAFVRHGYAHAFTRPGEPMVELHWALAQPFFGFHVDLDSLWPRLVRVALPPRQVLAPAPEDLLLILSVHGIKHMWERLEWIASATEVARSGDIDLARALDEAARIGCERMVLLALRLGRDLLGAPLPSAIDARASSPSLAPLVERVWARLGRLEMAEAGGGELFRFQLGARERWRDRLAYLAGLPLATTPDDWAAHPLPEPLAFLYPATRVMRLGTEHVIAPLRRALGRG